MAKVISQETFDGVVQENIVDFSMDPQEAKEETIKQFEAQGINLANIITDLQINEETGRPVITEAIDALKCHLSGEQKLPVDSVVKNLQVLESECKKSIPHRVFADKLGANNILVTIVENQLTDGDPNLEILVASLKSFNALLNKQPDLFDAESLSLVIKLLQQFKENYEVLSLTLQWLGKSCIMHELNRQNIVGAEIMTYLKPLVGIKNDVIIRDLCACFRYLILDDDIRVEFGKAHEHARTIASFVLLELTQLLPEYEDPTLLSDMILTIASLAVRQELCVVVEDANGLEYLFDVMKKHPDHPKLMKEGLKLLRALAGNDTTKVHIVQKGAAPIVHNILVNHKDNEQVAGYALACISTLTLRVKDNSDAFFETGVAENIADVMSLHPKSKNVQRNAAWAIRNMVSRSREQCESFLSYGVEDYLNQAMTDHPSVLQDVKAALRDLGCKVNLKEEWTGTAEKVISK